MSEYQYYEFLAVDRPLDAAEQAQVRSLSTRARITATSFVNEYHWGDFRGDPSRLMERYYDAHLYAANWGTHRLMLRLPGDLLDPDVVEEYCVGDQLNARVADGFVVLDFTSEDHAGEFDFDHDAEALLSALVGVRAELAAGDLRPLYVAWLAAYGAWERDEDAFDRDTDDDLVPPVPPGLDTLTAAQRALADFLRLDQDLLAVAAQTSPPLAPADDPGELTAWVTRLPVGEKNRLLGRVLQGDAARVQMEVLRRFRGDTAPTTTPVNPAAGSSSDAASVQQGSRHHEEDTGRAVVDLRPGAPDLRTFPRSRWEAAVRQVLRDASDAELGYSAPWGVPGLRDQLASYLGRVRGAVAAPDSIVVTSGATQALTIFTRTLVRRGHRSLAVEDPSNAVQRGVLASHGVQVLDVPVDADGIDVAALARTGARAVLVTPAHQFPTGSSLSPQRRAALLRWARAVDGVVIEDDYDAEFRYDGQTAACVQGDDPMRVALVGSVSKTLAPALRLGWIVPPIGLVNAVAGTKRDDDFGTDVITQLAFAHLLQSGRYDRHLRTVRKLYAQRRADLVRELVQHLPDWRITGLAAGQHLSIELPRTLDEAAVAEQARRRGVLVLEMSSMRSRPGPPRSSAELRQDRRLSSPARRRGPRRRSRRRPAGASPA